MNIWQVFLCIWCVNWSQPPKKQDEHANFSDKFLKIQQNLYQKKLPVFIYKSLVLCCGLLGNLNSAVALN